MDEFKRSWISSQKRIEIEKFEKDRELKIKEFE